MNAEFFDALDMLEQTRGIPKEYMLERVEAALLSAYKREKGRSNVRIAIDQTKKDIRVYECRDVVAEVSDPETQISVEEARKISRRYDEGSVVETEVKTKTFGRISAQTAKQVIIQGIREAERTNMIKEYEKRREEVVTAVVTKVLSDTGDVVVDTGTSEATLVKAEQIPGETLAVGDRIKVFITEVRRDSLPGPIVTLSRSHPGLVKRLFELEVPEIADGVVIIKGIAREAGSRTKISVISRDENVDAVGACIGNRGARIQTIVDELCGEKIDVVNFSETPEIYIAAALSPAEVKDVEFDGERSARVIVDGEQLSLAIGKEGQNARLAAKLTGFKIDIKGVKPAEY